MATRILGPKMNLVRASLPFSMSFLSDGLLNSPLLRISEYVRDAHSQGSVSAVADVLLFSEFNRAARVALIAGYPGSFRNSLGIWLVGGLVFLVLGLAAYKLLSTGQDVSVSLTGKPGSWARVYSL